MPPVIGAIVGAGLTVNNTDALLLQPEPFVTVYVIVVVPALNGVTKPVLLTVAIPGLTLLHVPPVLVVDNCDVLLPHTAGTPVIGAIGAGEGLTVTVTFCVAVQPY